ncbi:MAG TPA: bifunctional diguanylate cyclase/phosphodiesterase [Pyrinomonadaceae bacterium]
MRGSDKFALFYLLALLPLSIVAAVWAVSGLPSERVDLTLIVFALAFVLAAGQLRIQLPKTGLYLSLADPALLFFLVYFGGELALIAGVASALTTPVGYSRKAPISFVWRSINLCISITTIFATAVILLVVFGPPKTVIADHDKTSLTLLVAVLALLPYAINVPLASAYLAIRGDMSYWRSLKTRGADAIIVHLGSAIVAGLAVVALQETNPFLFFTAVGFFVTLQIAFRRYKTDYTESQKQVAKAERGRAELAEKHITDLKHYIGELEQTSRALKESREKYRHAAYHDPLTGLPNRNHFVDLIERLIKKARYGSSVQFALLCLDLRRFKNVNDSLGNAAGDHLISQVASRLSDNATTGETIGRFSGDEFAVLIPNVASVDAAVDQAERMIDALSEPFVLDGRQVFTGVASGIAIGGSHSKTADDLLRDADIAMYRAKERNRSLVIFEENMRVQAVSLMQLETDLRLAIERNEFELFYQPILDLETMRFAGVEALVRWSHPKIGRIAPDKFIEVSEATGLIIPMTLQILESACVQLKAWNSRPYPSGQLFASINLSGRHFMHPDVVEHIDHILQKTCINPLNIKLEITETAVMDNAERAATVLKRIKDLGVQLSIDDFGTGYSSLSYLQRFPIDTLKIDRSFVRSMEDGRQNGEIVRAILALADAMNLSVVAEGIESVHQLHQLRILNCQFGQGFLFSHPVPATEIAALLENPARWENLVSGSTFSIVPPSIGAAVDEHVH